MTAALLNCENDWEGEHVRPCVTSLACWWKEIHELEILLGYDRSTLAACQAWDELLASEIPVPRPALYIELRACVRMWNRVSHGQRVVYPTLLDRLLETAVADDLPFPECSILAAFRLRQRLSGMASPQISMRNGNRCLIGD